MNSWGYPVRRMRRLRQMPRLRRMMEMDSPGPGRLIWPVFVVEGRDVAEPIEALPGQCRYSFDRLVGALEPVVESGIGGLLLFGVMSEEEKDDRGSRAVDPDGLVARAVRAVRNRFPELVVFTDVCLCAYTSHGHCGPLNVGGTVENDEALDLLARMAVVHAGAGATGVAPSAMMDGQVKALREALDAAGHRDTLIMSYSTKFASSFYGPFREAARSSPGKGDRCGYQASFADGRRALLESTLDEGEGADLLMVKPALGYLDVIARLRDRTDLPIAAFNVSGEYAMVMAAAERGWGDWRAMAREILTAMARAGADVLISYWADRYREIFHVANW